MNSRPNTGHDPFEHLATKEALTAVATRLDATLPHLATKADVKEANNRLLLWLVGTLLTGLLTFYGLHSSMLAAQQHQLGMMNVTLREIQEDLRAVTLEQARLSNEFERTEPRRDEAPRRAPTPQVRD